METRTWYVSTRLLLMTSLQCCIFVFTGRFKDASMERMTAKLQPLKPDELLNLLKSVDYDDVIKEEESQVMSLHSDRQP